MLLIIYPTKYSLGDYSLVNLAQKVPNIYKTDSMAEFLRTAKGTPTKPRTAKIHQNFPELRAIGVVFYISAAMGWILILFVFKCSEKYLEQVLYDTVFQNFSRKSARSQKAAFFRG